MTNKKFVPKVGDDVTYPSGFGVVKVADPDQNGIIIITNSLGEYIRVSLHNIEPLKTTDEIEREATIREMRDYISHDYDTGNKIAETLYNAGYRKQPKVKILTRNCALHFIGLSEDQYIDLAKFDYIIQGGE